MCTGQKACRTDSGQMIDLGLAAPKTHKWNDDEKRDRRMKFKLYTVFIITLKVSSESYKCLSNGSRVIPTASLWKFR